VDGARFVAQGRTRRFPAGTRNLPTGARIVTAVGHWVAGGFGAGELLLRTCAFSCTLRMEV
jgi:hypothetical protein